MQERRSNADRSQQTRAALLEAGRAIFVEKGFAQSATPDVVARANLTRGALYHHFSGKQALFRAVVEAEAAQIAAEIDAETTEAKSPLDALLAGARAFFTAMQKPGRARLLLVEGPSALGPEEMRRIDLETGGQALRQGITEAMGSAALPSEIAATADLVSAMFDRAALAADGGADVETYSETIAALLKAMVQRNRV